MPRGQFRPSRGRGRGGRSQSGPGRRRGAGPPRKRVATGRLRDDTVDAPELESDSETPSEDEEVEEVEEEEEEEEQEIGGLTRGGSQAQPFNSYKTLLDLLRKGKDKKAESPTVTGTKRKTTAGAEGSVLTENKRGQKVKGEEEDEEGEEDDEEMDDLAEDEDVSDEDDRLEDGDVDDESDHENQAPERKLNSRDEDEDEESTAIPFNSHTNPDPGRAARAIQAIKNGKLVSHVQESATGGKFIIYIPGQEDNGNASASASTSATTTAKPPPQVDLTTSPQSLGIKQKLLSSPSSIFASPTSPHDRELISHIFNYRDLLYGNRTVSNAGRLRDMTAMHMLNHVLKTRDRVLRTNEKVSRHQQQQQRKEAAGERDGEGDNAADSSSHPLDDQDLRDQGFTRPKVLIISETRNCCAKWVDAMMRICQPEQQENKKRFLDGFVDDDVRDGWENGSKFPSSRPADFKELFEGNDDNDFRVGIKFTRKTVKFFSQFYQSDVIMASALGLRRTIEHPSKSKKEDSDFLSSIEILVIDQADAIAMQNWEHITFILSHLNRQPVQSHGCDFSRVRPWYLDNESRYYRQTLVFSAYITPELNGSLFNQNMQNLEGKVKYKSHYKGLIESVAMGLNFRQTFSRFASATPWDDSDERFEYFKSTVIPWIGRINRTSSRSSPLGLLLFVPQYADWLRIRNHFAFSTDQITKSIPYGLISEYTEAPDVQRARSHFQDGRISVIIYSGRAHHFRRYNLKGVKRVVMYGLPENPVFYSEMTEGFIGRSIGEGKADPNLNCSVNALFSKWDVLKLERIVGTERVREMAAESKAKSFEFV